MLIILAMLAAFNTAPIDAAEGGTDGAWGTYFQGYINVGEGEIATIILYNGDGLEIDREDFDYPGTHFFNFYLGNFDGSTDIAGWRATAVWNDGTPPYAISIHNFRFPDDFVFTYPGKCWIHTYNF